MPQQLGTLKLDSEGGDLVLRIPAHLAKRIGLKPGDAGNLVQGINGSAYVDFRDWDTRSAMRIALEAMREYSAALEQMAKG